ncbi:hypothetical protein K474DRAFT_782722 [Panus rudis PR-1116 ss-1]|nr:hypothetical protein K474DRAFT_782722 [Panus rudis PR-1116 ss-1]
MHTLRTFSSLIYPAFTRRGSLSRPWNDSQSPTFQPPVARQRNISTVKVFHLGLPSPLRYCNSLGNIDVDVWNGPIGLINSVDTQGTLHICCCDKLRLSQIPPSRHSASCFHHGQGLRQAIASGRNTQSFQVPDAASSYTASKETKMHPCLGCYFHCVVTSHNPTFCPYSAPLIC